MTTETFTGLTYQEAGSLQTDALQNAELALFGPAIAGTVTREFSTDASITLVAAEYWTSYLLLTDSPATLTTGRDIVFPAHFPRMTVKNATAQTLTLKKSGQTGFTLAAGATTTVVAGVVDVIDTAGAAGAVTSVNGATGIVVLGGAEIGIADAGGYFTGTDVEAALQELGAAGGGGSATAGRTTFCTTFSQGTTLHQLGCLMAGNGTAVSANPSSTNAFTAQRRLLFRATASASACSGFTHTNTNWIWRGNAANLGGFDFTMRWGAGEGVTNTSCRAFAGVSAASGPASDVNPSTLTDMMGMGWDSADTNIQMMHNDASGTATKIDLGASFPVPVVDSTSVYEIRLVAAANAASVDYTVTDIGTGATASGTISTDLPANTVMMSPRAYLSAGGVSTQMGFAFMDLRVIGP